MRPIHFVKMTDAHLQKDERWLRNEKQGRILSSLAALGVVYFAQSNVVFSAQLLALFSCLDLVRASQLNHNVGPLIVLHHCVVLYMVTIYDSLQSTSKWWTSIAQRFLLMEVTNPFLHTAWILMYASEPQIKSKFRWIAYLLFGIVVFLWPQYRIGSLLVVVYQFLAEDKLAMMVPTLAMLSLQIFWYSKILGVVQKLWSKTPKST